MRMFRWSLTATVLSALLVGVRPALIQAQGTTTGAITGTVTDEGGAPVDAAQIEVVNRATGFRSASLTRTNGRYLVTNLEVGAQYRVTVRRIGFAPETRDDIRITLGEATRVDVVLHQAAQQLTGIRVTATAAGADFAPTRQGAQTVLSDTLIRRIPTLNRDVTDLARLAPQVAPTTSGGPSAAGGFNRFNSYTIDGSSQNDRFNLNGSGGTPGGATGGRIVPIDAVKEVQVLLSPTDVRYGNFVGMNLNAVTRNGTNKLEGGATYTFRNPSLAYDTTYIKTGNLRQQQYGFYLGGPIIKDRLHFFTATEWQQRTAPNAGASIVSASDASAGIGKAQIDSVISISKSQYGFDAGGAGVLQLKTPLTNFMGRLDWQATENTRLVFRQLVNKAEQVDFSRNTSSFNYDPSSQGSGVRLTSNQVPRTSDNNSSTLQIFSNFSRLANEFSAAYNTVKDVRNPPLKTPEISIKSGASQITLGTEQFSPVNLLDQKIFELTDNVTIPLGDHNVTVGARYEYNKFLNDFEQRIYGAYKFNSIADYAAGKDTSYSVGFSNGADLAARFRTNMSSAYLQDRWAVGHGVTVTGGVRVDVPSMPDTPANNTQIATLFAARGLDVSTAVKPKTQALFSPRVGFNWDVTGTQTFQVRGNAGLFTGQPPYVMLGNAYQNTGTQLVFLNCGGNVSGTTAPTFTTDVSALPRSCAGQPAPTVGSAGTAGINLNDPNFKFPQRFISTFGVDKALPGGFVFTGEALYGKDVNGLFIRDLNLLGPKMNGSVPFTDRNGRIIYADSISASNAAIINANSETRAITKFNGVNFSEGAVYLTNQSKAYNYSFTGQLRKRFGEAFSASGSYTYTRAYDVQSLTSDRAVSNFRNGRTLAGLESEPTLGTSAFERRHLLKAFGTYTAPWKRYGATDFSLRYSGVAGFPITYTANGDLNGDGVTSNDPIYVPKSAYDPNEIRFNGTAQQVVNQQAAFERFIQSQPCLNSQRGKIMERNSCRGPWTNLFDFSVRQSLPEIAGQNFTAQLDIFNFGNLLNNRWGRQNAPTLSSSFPQQAVLIARSRQGTAANPVPLNQQQVVFDFSQTSTSRGAFSIPDNSVSSLYQMQLTFRYSF
ncbi:MAG TPA: carboxypeptidase regulatory-like domain-containing protein [Gemmatimonadaceae bacterium]|nr:carboxypeptidase regulatory-like domain-containing protein [Gemmatimonadaceae bacterium]